MAETPSPAAKFPFDLESGDVLAFATYQGQRVSFKVDCGAMPLASPVWKKFLFPPFPTLPGAVLSRGCDVAENSKDADASVVLGESNSRDSIFGSQKRKQSEIGDDDEETRSAKRMNMQTEISTPQTGEWKGKTLDFTNDDSEALLILINIAHLKFTGVLGCRMKYHDLLQVAILCDQYECVHLVGPWLSKWLGTVDEQRVDATKIGQENWVFIAWVFGMHHMFDYTSYHLANNMHTNEQGRLVDRNGFEIDVLVPGLMEHLVATRKMAIESFLKFLYDDIGRYALVVPKTICNKGATVGEAKNCDATAYGARLLTLQSFRMWPRKSVADIRLSVYELGQSLKTYPSVYASYLSPRGAPREPAHRSCHGPAYPEHSHSWNILNLNKNHSSGCHGQVPMLEMHRTHIAAQSRALRGCL